MNRFPSEPSARPTGPNETPEVRPHSEEVGAVWQVHRRWIAAVLLAHMSNDADLEDLLQEVALVVMKKLHQLQDPNRLRPWLRSVAINAARGSARKQNAGLKLVTLEGEESFDPIDEVQPRRELHETTRVELAHVLRLVRQLSPEHREPLLLKGVDGLSQREIADALEISEDAVESRIARARRKLREAMYKRSGSSTFHPPHSS